MFKRIFGSASAANRKITDALYEQIVAAARQPLLYAEWNVPDTPLGRFEMIALHVFLVLHRLRGEAGDAADVAQNLTDAFFADVEHSIRELGIGDLGVPKRMKKLARMFYGRAVSYGEAIDSGDRASLAAALARNVRPDDAVVAAGWRPCRLCAGGPSRPGRPAVVPPGIGPRRISGGCVGLIAA